METAQVITAWVVGLGLMIGGLAGTFLPVVPGPLVIFLGAVSYWAILWGEAKIGIGGFIVLFVLLALTQIVEMLSSAVGAKVFGASKWGALGAIVGGIIGFFFGIIGIVVGPLIGAFAFEMLFAKKKIKPATKSTWGTFIGATAGIVIKVAIGVLMIGWFFVDVFWVHWLD